MKGKAIPFKLRPGKDDDIAEDLEEMVKATTLDRSDIIRMALREYFEKRKREKEEGRC